MTMFYCIVVLGIVLGRKTLYYITVGLCFYNVMIQSHSSGECRRKHRLSILDVEEFGTTSHLTYFFLIFFIV